MTTMGSPYFVWKNTNEISSPWYLLDAVCVTPPPCPHPLAGRETFLAPVECEEGLLL